MRLRYEYVLKTVEKQHQQSLVNILVTNLI